MDNNESQVRTVSEIFGCSRDVAKEMLVKFEWDINKVLDECSKESVMEMEVELSSSAAGATGNEGGISSVLKRKMNAEEPYVVIIDENEKKKAKEDFEEIASLGPTTEPCPACSAPNFIPDKGLARYTCIECGADMCRLCYMQAHGEGQECAMEGYKKVTVLPSRNFDAENELDREFRIAEGQFLRMMSKRKNYEIKSIEVVRNDKLEKKFNAKKEEFKKLGIDDKPLFIFHGTPVKNIEAILRHNFDLSKMSNGRKFGDGVYFSEKPEVSVRYADNWKPMSSLILCLVLKGTNSKEVTSTGSSVNTEETGKAAWAIVVPDTDQILPKYVINFKEVVERPTFPQNNFPHNIRARHGIPSRARFGGLSGIGHVNHIFFPPSSSAHLGHVPNFSSCFSQQGQAVPPPTLVQAAGQVQPPPPSTGQAAPGQAVPPPTLVQAPGQVQPPPPSTAQAAPADPHQLVQMFPTLVQDLKKLQKMLQSPVLQQAMNMILSTQDPQANAGTPVQMEAVNTNASVLLSVEGKEESTQIEVGVNKKKAAKDNVDMIDDGTGTAGVESGTDLCIDGSADETARDFFIKIEDTWVASREGERREDSIGGVAPEKDKDEGSSNTGTDDFVGNDFLVKIGDVWVASKEEDQEGN